MDDRIMQFRVGVVVLAVTLIAGFLTLLFGHFPKSFINKTYTVYVEFTQAPGIAPDTPVRKNGILIGRVTQVELIGEQQDRVRVTLSIDQDKKILHSDIVRINVSLLGDAEVQVIPAPDKQTSVVSPSADRGVRRAQFMMVADEVQKPANKPVEPGETIKGTVANNPTQTFANLEPELIQAARSLTAASEQVNRWPRISTSSLAPTTSNSTGS